MFDQVFKNIETVLKQDPGMDTELDYTEQISWLLFLKYIDDLEEQRNTEAILEGKQYEPLFKEEFRWRSWAAPKNEDGTRDRNSGVDTPDLCDFVNQQLFEYLKGFKDRATSPDAIEYKIGATFAELQSKFQNSYLFRDAIDHIDSLSFGDQENKQELSDLYETRLNKMGNAGRGGGQYYTPRSLIRAMIQVVNPQLGETIYDPACGTAGFLCEAYTHLRQANETISTEQLDTLNTKTLYGKELKSLSFIIANMNMIFHGVESPNIVRIDTLLENLAQVQERDQYDIILANPPFGGGIIEQTQKNFLIESGESAYLFLQHFIAFLKTSGRAAVVIKNTFLSNDDNASRALRQEILRECNLHTILDCPGGTFLGAGVKTVVLFFQKGSPTKKVWYYQLDPGRNMGKTNPLNDHDLKEFLDLQPSFADSDKSWTINVNDVDDKTFDLSVNNPNKEEEAPLRDPQEILKEISALDAESAEILEKIRGML